eukprot:TRINITY_DN3820_c0_g1_i9.p1 TRINITY_DN3820_c0_g1~~TRINITY_DN3820_c0_g1_i9.p1  ORF type:complete len:238 (+),score=55.33 TRINITY_DN3820_c0_g1_i9:172-885(+)
MQTFDRSYETPLFDLPADCPWVTAVVGLELASITSEDSSQALPEPPLLRVCLVEERLDPLDFLSPERTQNAAAIAAADARPDAVTLPFVDTHATLRELFPDVPQACFTADGTALEARMHTGDAVRIWLEPAQRPAAGEVARTLALRTACRDRPRLCCALHAALCLRLLRRLRATQAAVPAAVVAPLGGAADVAAARLSELRDEYHRVCHCDNSVVALLALDEHLLQVLTEFRQAARC